MMNMSQFVNEIGDAGINVLQIRHGLHFGVVLLHVQSDVHHRLGVPETEDP
jgi:hypothetical protein